MGVAGLIAGIGAIAFLIAVAWYILQVVAKWKMFTKMGEAGWKSIIPIYSDYILYKKTWKPVFFWVIFAIALVLSFVQSSQNAFVSAIAFILVIAAIVIAIVQLNKMSKAFGHGTGFTVGLVFFYPIFLLILGFGSSQYIGNKTE